MKIHVTSQGKTVIDADLVYQEPAVRTVINDMAAGSATGYDVASTIMDYTDTDKSNISHDEHAVVTEDDGTVLWSGWLTGNPDAAPPDARWQALKDDLAARIDSDWAVAEGFRDMDERVSAAHGSLVSANRTTLAKMHELEKSQ